MVVPQAEDDRRRLLSQIIATVDPDLDLDGAVALLRAEGKGWRLVERGLLERYGVDVPFPTLVRWYKTSVAAPT